MTPDLPDEIEALAFVVGTWETDEGFAEHWTAVGDVLYGVAFSPGGFELLKIDREGSVVRYVARPNGGPSTAFTLVRQNTARAVFTNPEHDDPKRIDYRRDGPERLTAVVSGVGRFRLEMEARPVRPVADLDEVDPERDQVRTGWAPSGDLAFSVGTWGAGGVVAGAYATVWRPETDGTWTVVAEDVDPVEDGSGTVRR